MGRVGCRGEALDSDDWLTPGFVALAAEHGWIRTAANDPTERHHFEYQWHRDQHRHDPAPTISKPATVAEEDEDTMTRNILYKTTEPKSKYPIRFAVTNDTSGLWIEAVDNQAGTMNTLADRYQTGDAIEVSGSMFAAARNAAAQVRPQANLAVTVGEPEYG